MKNFLILLFTILLLTSCIIKKDVVQPSKNMTLENKNVLIVVAPIDFRDEEYTEPRQVLENAGAEIKVSSIQSGVAKGVAGTETKIDLTVSEVDVNNFDAVVFIGGPGMNQIIGDESLQILAKKFYNANKLTTAICVAPAILARTGILQGKQATSWSSVEEDLNNGGAVYTGKAVTVDGRIITANGPEAAREFGEKIVEVLSNQ